jgi:hypothetical protein
MKKITALLLTALLALGAQAAGGHAAKSATLAHAKSRPAVSAEGASVHKAGAKGGAKVGAKAQLRKPGSVHKHVAHAKPGRKAPRKHA